MNKKIEDQETKYLEIDKNERKKFKLSTSSLINGIVGIGVVGAGVGKLISDDIAIKKFQEEDVLTTPIWIVDETKEKILEDSLKEVDEEYEETLNYNIENDSLKGEEKSEYQILDFNLYSSTDTQKEFLNDTARLITKFHEQTHKENNFKLDEDDEHYLDLTLDEVISLNIMLNEYSEEEMTEIFGSYKLDSQKIDSSIKSLYDKLIVYYMNAKEKSYISDIIKDEEKKKIFEDIEEKVLRFNQDTNKKNNNEIKKDKFYQYITRGSREDYYYDDFILFISRAPFMGFMLNDVEKSKSEIKSIINDENLIKSLSRRSKLLEIGINNANKNYLKILEFEQEKNKKDKEKLLGNIDKNSSSFFGMDINKTIKDISGSDVKKIASKIYDNNLIEKTVGLTFSQVKDKINFNKLDNQYNYSSINNLDFLVTVRRKKAFIRFFKNPKIVNDNQLKNDEQEKNKISSSNIEKEEVFTRKK